LKPDPLVVRSNIAEYSNIAGYNALQLAGSTERPTSPSFLLDWGWCLETNDNKLLLGVTIDNLSMMNSNQSLLGLTIGNKYIETVSDLLNRGADPNVEFNFFCTLRPIFPIFKAVEIGSTELVKLLLDYRASADMEDFWGGSLST
jgi:hypothetical protein